MVCGALRRNASIAPIERSNSAASISSATGGNFENLTINPALAHGMAHVIGSIEVGKLADLVLWKPAFFGVKPSLVLKGGMIALAAMLLERMVR